MIQWIPLSGEDGTCGGIVRLVRLMKCGNMAQGLDVH